MKIYSKEELINMFVEDLKSFVNKKNDHDTRKKMSNKLISTINLLCEIQDEEMSKYDDKN